MEGTLQKVDGSYVLRFERPFKHPIEKVWAAITEPERIVEWLANAVVETSEGGRYELRFNNTESVMLGKVTQIEAPKLLEYVWNSEGAKGTRVRFELHPAEEGCLLVLTHTFGDTNELPSFAAGWHVHLDLLAEALTGVPKEWPWDCWHEWNAKYEAQFAEFK